MGTFHSPKTKLNLNKINKQLEKEIVVKEKTTRKEESDKMRKLDEETETFKVETVNKSISKAIMEARTKLNMKQKDLATKVNVQPQIIQQYENGKAKPDIAILRKLERVLKCKLKCKIFTK